MKVFLLKAGLDNDKCLSKASIIIDGIVGDEHRSNIENGLIDADLFICDLQNIQGSTSHTLYNQKHLISSGIKGGAVLLCFAGRNIVNGNITNYKWLEHFGAFLSPENQSAEEIKFENIKPFSKLLIEDDFNYNVIFNKDPAGDYKLLAKNKAGHFVAFYANIDNGHVFILPRPKNKDAFVKHFIDKILSLLKLNFTIENGSKEDVPESIRSLKIVGQNELMKEIKKQEQKIDKEVAELNRLHKKNEKLESWKKLLWETGDPLEEIVKEFFKLFNLNLKREKIDLVGKYKEKEVFIEVKGKKGGIDHKGDFRQIEERKNYDSENPQNTIAILIGNPFRLEPITNRPPESKSLFAPTSLPIAENLKIGLISTQELFKILKDVLSGEVDKDKILEEMMNSAGIYKYKKKKEGE
jgi:hypothetical protein